METSTYKKIEHAPKRKASFFLVHVLSILAGLVFLFGGLGVVSAQEYDSRDDERTTTGVTRSSSRAGEKATAAALANGATATEANRAGTAAVATAESLREKSGDAIYDALNCYIGLGGSDMSGCFPMGIYYVIYKPASFILILASKIFNFTLFLGIEKQYVYPGGDEGFIATSWTIMRDVSNMAFIFVLLYTGISTMLGFGNWKRTVIQVVIIALLVNFSLFFTKVVIDAGNVLAVGVYSALGPAPAGQIQDLSTSLVAAFQPQSFISLSATVTSFDAIVIFLIAAAVALAVSWVLFKVALLFIGRLLAFWFLMIVSPFAFISSTFPKGNKFNQWLDMLLSQAFVAPVFLFMLYIIMKVVNAGILQGFVNNSPMTFGDGITDKLIMPVLIAILIVVALSKAKDFAESMAGEFGKLGASIGTKVIGGALGLTAGGGCFGRQVCGTCFGCDSSKTSECAGYWNVGQCSS